MYDKSRGHEQSVEKHNQILLHKQSYAVKSPLAEKETVLIAFFNDPQCQQINLIPADTTVRTNGKPNHMWAEM